MEDKMRYYLAYGSNLNVSQMKLRCPEARIAGTAVIPDHRLLFRGSRSGSYLTVEPMKGAGVPVGVWQVTPENELSLDRYEGFPRFYRKKEVNIHFRDIRSGRIMKAPAFLYLMRSGRPAGIPTPRYYDICREGYSDFRFDENTLERAYYDSVEIRQENDN